MFDGYYAIRYNNKNLTKDDILSAYSSLWRIEESFRTMKHFFQTRPMFHWTPKRIEGNVALNYIALVIEKRIEEATNLSQNQIRDALSRMERSILNLNGANVHCHSNISEQQKLILRRLKIQIPKNFVVN